MSRSARLGHRARQPFGKESGAISRPQGEPKRKVAEFPRRREGSGSRSAPEITADHVPRRPIVDVAGITSAGFCRRHERWNFRGCAQSRRVGSHRSIGFYRRPKAPGRSFKNRRCLDIWASISDDAEYQGGAARRSSAGLIIVEGRACSKAAGHRADAFRSGCRRRARRGKFRLANVRPAPAAKAADTPQAPARRRVRDMELKVTHATARQGRRTRR